jgi:hypothetical protein
MLESRYVDGHIFWGDEKVRNAYAVVTRSRLQSSSGTHNLSYPFSHKNVADADVDRALDRGDALYRINVKVKK